MVWWLGRLKKLMLISTSLEVVVEVGVDLYVAVVEAQYFIGWVGGGLDQMRI